MKFACNSPNDRDAVPSSPALVYKVPGNYSEISVLSLPYYAHLLFGDGVGGRGRTAGASVVSGSRWDAADMEQVPHQQKTLVYQLTLR